MPDFSTLTIKKASEGLRGGEWSAEDLAETYKREIAARDGGIHAYLEVFDDIDTQAKRADGKLKEGKGGPLTGIPLAIKDNILMEGRAASAASKILEPYRASYNATVTEKLMQAGAVFLGRTNMDEFAMGSSTENSAFGPTKNPHDTSRVTGGSSGGSAAAVAAGMAPAALGSDTGGSIRQPASFCGIVGLKPTYGAVSRYGLIAMGSSLDQIGPLAKTVEDAEILFKAIAGYDAKDSTSLLPEERENDSENGEKKYVIGIPEDFLNMEGIDAAVRENFNETVEALAKEGHTVRTIALPHFKYALASYYIIMPAEASTNLARFDGVRYGLSIKGESALDDYAKTRGEGFGREVRRRILLGTYVLSAGYYDAYYNKATAVRALIRKDLDNAFAGADIIAMPTVPTPAFKLGEKTEDPLAMYLADIFTVPMSLAGVPALSVPSGSVTRDGKELPLGIQFVAPHCKEARLFSIGKIAEEIC